MLDATDLRRPLLPGWSLLVGTDTGSYMSAVFVLFPPDDGDCFVVHEHPNYRYVGGEIELLGYSIPEWSRELTAEYSRYKPGVTKMHGWCDENSQFKSELRNYNIQLQGNKRKLALRVEISREYFNNRRVHLAPWLSVLPWELEHAVWPEETTSAGKFERLKVDDHTLDGVEHVLSRRPRHKSMTRQRSETFVQRHLRLNKRHDLPSGRDPHLGAQ